MQPLNLTQLSIGERVQHELLVVERLEKTQGNGYLFKAKDRTYRISVF